MRRQGAKSAKEDAKVRIARHSCYNPGHERGRFVAFVSGAEWETDQVASAVIGAAIEVHRRLGPGHKESVYKSAMCHELGLKGIPFACEVQIKITYKGKDVGVGLLDLVVAERVIIELKAVEQLAAIHTSQAISYLRMTGLTLALPINFNVSTLKDGLKRVVLS
jgi:GxxExxY protein